MTTEQRAKAYDEAIERAKKWYNAPNSDKMPTYANRVVEEIFPELCESEDEKIRKFLIKWVQDNYYHSTTGIPTKTLIAWLEKQGNPTDEDMKEALRTEYEKGRADVIAQMREEWSEKDEKILKEIISDVKFEGYNNDMQANSYKKINWLKSIKDRVQSQPKQEWSEEDEKMIKKIMHILSLDGRISNEELKDMFDWLKSLRSLKE